MRKETKFKVGKYLIPVILNYQDDRICIEMIFHAQNSTSHQVAIFQIDPWRFNPQAFKVIKVPKRLVKQVDDYIPIIQ